MTPAEFTRSIEEVCKGRDFEAVKREGTRLLNEVLGPYADTYLDGLGILVDRLRVLKPMARPLGPPTTQSIADAKVTAGEGRATL